MEGSTHTDEHHPLEKIDDEVVEDGEREKKQGGVTEQGKEMG